MMALTTNPGSPAIQPASSPKAAGMPAGGTMIPTERIVMEVDPARGR
jgi:hypothetical protein